MKYFDPSLLHTLIAFADTGTLARASEIVGRTPSAITTQMQRLEEVAGIPLFRAKGRRRILTEAGEQLLIHARRILIENKEAWLSISGMDADGRIRLGITQDFVDHALPGILNLYSRTHPCVRIDLHVGRSHELSEDFKSRKIDILVSMRQGIEQDEIAVMTQPMEWFCSINELVRPLGNEIPIAVLDPPCGFRTAAINALNDAQKSYRTAATSPSLAGILAPIRAGLAVTVRTSTWADNSLKVAPITFGLPSLPDAHFSVRVQKETDNYILSLTELLVDGLNFKYTQKPLLGLL